MLDTVYYISGDTIKKGTIEKLTIRYGEGTYEKETLETPHINVFATEKEAKEELKHKLQIQMETLQKRMEHINE